MAYSGELMRDFELAGERMKKEDAAGEHFKL